MQITESSFDLKDQDFYHSVINYDALIEIVLFLEKNSDKELAIIDLALKIPLITKWNEMAIEQNIFFLEEICLLVIVKTQDYPLRKYKFEVNTKNFNLFKRMTDIRFVLECDYSISDYYLFFENIQKEVENDYKEILIKKWRNTILDNYSRYEQKEALIKERELLREHYKSDKNPLKFYDISNFEVLAKKMQDAITYREKIPLPLNPSIIFNSLLKPIEKLERALRCRFYAKLEIDTLNSLIETQVKFSEFYQTCDLKQKSLLDNLYNKKSIVDKLNYWKEIKSYFEKSYPLCSTLSIPSPIFDELFAPYENSPEYFKWLDKYEIELYFQSSDLFKTLQTKLKGNYKKEFIESELEKIIEFEGETSILTQKDIEKELIELKKNLEVDNNMELAKHLNLDESRFKKALNEIKRKEEQLEFLRITDETETGKYYDKQLIAYWRDTSNLCNNVAVQTYIKYILYKPYLEAKLKELEQPSPATPLTKSNISAPEKKENNKIVKPTTKEKYNIKLYAICDLVEKEWRKETDKTVEQLEKIYKKAKGEYAKSKDFDRSQLNTELKNTDGFEYIKKKLMNLYRENK